MFKESYRILKRGGIFRITAPNIDLDYRAYKDNDRYYFYWIDCYDNPKDFKRVKLNKSLSESSIQQILLYHFAASASMIHVDSSAERIDDKQLDSLFREMKYEDALNYCVSKCSIETQKNYPGNHINWWNKDKVFKMLEKAGFCKIYLSGYGQSFSPVLRNIMYFDNTHPKVSLYVEAIKL
jgi:hypothetical protein